MINDKKTCIYCIFFYPPQGDLNCSNKGFVKEILKN